MRWAHAATLLGLTSIACGPSVEPCTPPQCLALAERQLQGAWSLEWDTARIYLQRACDGGIAVACRELGSHGITISNERPEERGPAIAAYNRGCALGDGESCHMAAYHNADAISLNDRACQLKFQGGCDEAAMLRSKSPDADERRRALPGLEEGCRAHRAWMCSRLIQVFEEPPLKDEASARRARTVHCEAGERDTCTKLGFEAAVGLRTEKDPKEAQRLLVLGCASQVDCEAEKQLTRWLTPEKDRKILVRVLEANSQHFVVELPPDVSLPKGTEVAELGWSLKINDVAGFEGVVIEERKGESVMRQRATNLGGENSSFSATLYITPAKGSLVLLTVKEPAPQPAPQRP